MSIYVKGDIHGNPLSVINYVKMNDVHSDDTFILLGDVGVNYFSDIHDMIMKEKLNRLNVTFLCIQGNHEIRPANISSYKTEEWNGGSVWVEDMFPNLKFAKDGETYRIENKTFLVCGGAYSVDKNYRLKYGLGWWSDEQTSEESKRKILEDIKAGKNTVDYILTHTCPAKYTPTEMFITNVDQNTVDRSNEEFFDLLEEKMNYKLWYCGHWHTDKDVDKIRFRFNLVDKIE